MRLCDLDFTDLSQDDEKDVLAPRGLGGSVPPPPPPMGGGPLMGPPAPINFLPPPPTNFAPPPTPFGMTNNQMKVANGSNTLTKSKKTVKLFWKEVREDMIPVAIGSTIWDDLPKSDVDTQKLEHLFESRAKDLITKVY